MVEQGILHDSDAGTSSPQPANSDVSTKANEVEASQPAPVHENQEAAEAAPEQSSAPVEPVEPEYLNPAAEIEKEIENAAEEVAAEPSVHEIRVNVRSSSGFML